MKRKIEQQKERNKVNVYIIATFICAIICIFALSMQLTFSFFFDNEAQSGIFNFGKIKVNTTILDTNSTASTLNFTSAQMYPGAVIDRDIQISVPSDAEDCLVRIWMSFKQSPNEITDFNVAAESNDLIMTIRSSGQSDWTLGANMSNGKSCFYYYTSLATNASVTVPVSFTYNQYAPNSNQGLHYAVRVYVEAIQSANNAYVTDWIGEYPSVGWPNERGEG